MSREKFDSAIKGWEEHCDNVSHSSGVFIYVNCVYLDQIQQMGIDAVPLMRVYHNNPEANVTILSDGFAIITKELFPDFSVPNSLSGRRKDVADYVYEFLGSKDSKLAKQ